MELIKRAGPRSRVPPTDTRLRKALQGVLAATPAEDLATAPPSSKTSKTAEPDANKPVVKWADKALAPKAPTAPCLEAAAWLVPVIKASNVEKHDFDKPCVIACCGENDRARTLSWIRARGVTASVTIAILCSDKTTSNTRTVLVHGPAGS